MISYPHNCIFIHIPKTGGTSIEKIIWPSGKDKVPSNLSGGFIDPLHNKYQTGGLQHLLGSQICQEVGQDIFNRFFKFTIVRNPWDKVISQYAYMKRRRDLRNFIGMEESDSLKTYLTLTQKTKHVQWEPQYRFIFDDNGEKIVDYIGRLETFNDDVMTILEKIKLDRTFFGLRKRRIPHSNKTSRGHYREYFDEESSEMVRDMYKEDVELLDYAF